MNVTLNKILLVIAVVCFAIAFLISLETITSDDFDAWLTGGLLFFAGSFLP